MLVLGVLAVGVSGSSLCAKSKRQKNIDSLSALHEETREIFVELLKDSSLRQQQAQRDTGYWQPVTNLAQPLVEKINNLTGILNDTDVFRLKGGLFVRSKGFNRDTVAQACDLIGYFKKIKERYEESGLLSDYDKEDLDRAIAQLNAKARNIGLDMKAEAVEFEGLDIGR